MGFQYGSSYLEGTLVAETTESAWRPSGGDLRIPSVAIYARVSTSSQDVDVQLHELREYSVRRHWTVVGEYLDEGVSGSVVSRPALNRLMTAARRRAFDIVLVWKFDRFARSTRHLIFTLEEFRRLDIAFISLTEQIGTGSPLGEAIFAILGALAQFERDLIRERIHAGLRKARAEGKRLGRRPAAVDRLRIAELQRQGLSYRQIGRQLRIPRSTAHKYRDPTIVAGTKPPGCTGDDVGEPRTRREEDPR